MKKIFVAPLLLLLLTATAQAQTKTAQKTPPAAKKTTTAKKNPAAGFDKTARGLLYKIYKHGTGTQKAKVGDFVELHIQQVYTETDTVLIDSRRMNNNQPVQLKVQQANFAGDIPEGFTYMSEGDSAVFLVSIDTLAARMPNGLPPFFKKGNYLAFHVVMVSIKSEEQMQKEQAEKASKQITIDENMLQDYFKKNNITPMKTTSGVYYVIHTPGTGPNAKAGEKVSMKYTGMLLDGSKFDSNEDSAFHHMEPLTFPLGQGQVIRGWDEGITYLNKGAKATFYIPSTLAYGERSPGPSIPANSIMIFNVELLDIIGESPNQPMTPVPPAPPQSAPTKTKTKIK